MSDKAQPSRVKLDSRYVGLVRRIMALQRMNGDGSAKALGITSTATGEGTSTIATNLAMTLAGLNVGQVLLIDANDRQPMLHKVFKNRSQVGWRNALSGECLPCECLTATQVDRLSLVVNGRCAPGEPVLYSLSAINDVLDGWRDSFSWIIADLPAADCDTDITLLASRLDGVLLVVEADRADRETVERTAYRLRQSGVNLMGAVYNKTSKRLGEEAW